MKQKPEPLFRKEVKTKNLQEKILRYLRNAVIGKVYFGTNMMSEGFNSNETKTAPLFRKEVKTKNWQEKILRYKKKRLLEKCFWKQI